MKNERKESPPKKANIQKQTLRVQKLHHKTGDIRADHIKKTIAETVKTRLSYITIEDLNAKGGMKNRHLSKAADRGYPPSKTCHCCGVYMNL